LLDTKLKKKRKSQIDVSNYRGIAILSTVGKLFELLVYRYNYWFTEGQLIDCQHGFVKGRSTVLNLLVYSFFVLNPIEDGCQEDAMYTDFINAFDKVSHRLLLYKLSTGFLLFLLNLGRKDR
jgi:hypothetical protein